MSVDCIDIVLANMYTVAHIGLLIGILSYLRFRSRSFLMRFLHCTARGVGSQRRSNSQGLLWSIRGDRSRAA